MAPISRSTATRLSRTHTRVVAAIAIIATSLTAALPLAQSDAKVEEQVLVQGEAGIEFFVSPGARVTAVVPRGSRLVVSRDGVDGPRFDDILPGTTAARPSVPRLAFSPDGSRYAYLARLGQELVYIVDGRELFRAPLAKYDPLQFGGSDFGYPRFDPSGKRVVFMLQAKGASSPNLEHRLFVDGQAGPPSRQPIESLAFSADGSRYAYLVQPPSDTRVMTPVLVVDGKPATYVAGAPQFSADGKVLYTLRTARDVIEALADGKPFLRSPAGGGVALHPAPAGSTVMGVVSSGRQAGPFTMYLTNGAAKVPGSDCTPNNGPGIDGVYFSADGRHYAARCISSSGSWVIVDGKKGQEYQSIASGITFTADGRPVYQAMAGGKVFVVVGDHESDGYERVVVTPVHRATVLQHEASSGVVVHGNRYGFIAQSGPREVLVIDGKALNVPGAGELGFSPDGSRYAHVAAKPGGSGHQLVLDGSVVPGLNFLQPPRTPSERRYVFSPDGKRVAFAAFPDSNRSARGVAIDGKFMALRDVQSIQNITFTPDGRHVFWLARSARAPRDLIYMDGRLVLDLENNMELGQPDTDQWSMGIDGVLTVIAQDDGMVKRYRITPAGK